MGRPKASEKMAHHLGKTYQMSSREGVVEDTKMMPPRRRTAPEGVAVVVAGITSKTFPGVFAQLTSPPLLIATPPHHKHGSSLSTLPGDLLQHSSAHDYHPPCLAHTATTPLCFHARSLHATTCSYSSCTRLPYLLTLAATSPSHCTPVAHCSNRLPCRCHASRGPTVFP